MPLRASWNRVVSSQLSASRCSRGGDKCGGRRVRRQTWRASSRPNLWPGVSAICIPNELQYVARNDRNV